MNKQFIPLIIILTILPIFAVFGNAQTHTVKPSIVLVHGSWADGSSWSGVIRILQDQGYTVYAPPNPLRGLASDSAYIAAFLHTITGPIILVGHSYGGAVITNAATGNPNVKALVYVDGFAPDQNETLAQLLSTPPPPGAVGSCLGGDPASIFNFVPLTNGDVDLYIKPSVFPSCFANSIPADEAAVLASVQRPGALSGLTEKSGVPAWKSIPSWYVVGTLDRVIPPYVQLFMAQRAHSTIIMVRAPHPSMITQPQQVARVIEQAAGGSLGQANDNDEQIIL